MRLFFMEDGENRKDLACWMPEMLEERSILGFAGSICIKDKRGDTRDITVSYLDYKGIIELE